MEQILKMFTLDFFGKGKHKISPTAFFELEDVVFLDTRFKEEANALSIDLKDHDNVQSINIPINEIPDRISQIPKEKPIGLFCPSNIRSAMAYTLLLSKGFQDVRLLEGGYPALMQALMPGKILQVIQAAEYLKD